MNPVRARGEYFDNNRLEGAPRLTRIDPRMDFRWTLNSPGRGIPFDWYSARWTGSIVAPPSGVRRIGVEGNDGYRLYLDDALVDRQLAEAVVRHAHRRESPGAGLVARIRLEYFESTGNARLKLVWDAASRRQRERGLTKRWRSRAGATSRSSSPASKKASSATARCWDCPAGRRS